MFNKKLKLQIEVLNKENQKLYGELIEAQFAAAKELNDSAVKLGAAQIKVGDLEKDLKAAIALQHRLYDECAEKENELCFYRHTMAAIRALSQNGVEFVVRRNDNGVYIEVHTFDTDSEPVNVLLKDGYWNIETPDGLNGMLIKGRYQVSMMDIILMEDPDNEDEEEKEVYRISFDSNQLESL